MDASKMRHRLKTLYAHQLVKTVEKKQIGSIRLVMCPSFNWKEYNWSDAEAAFTFQLVVKFLESNS